MPKKIALAASDQRSIMVMEKIYGDIIDTFYLILNDRIRLYVSKWKVILIKTECPEEQKTKQS